MFQSHYIKLLTAASHMITQFEYHDQKQPQAFCQNIKRPKYILQYDKSFCFWKNICLLQPFLLKQTAKYMLFKEERDYQRFPNRYKPIKTGNKLN